MTTLATPKLTRRARQLLLVSLLILGAMPWVLEGLGSHFESQLFDLGDACGDIQAATRSADFMYRAEGWWPLMGRRASQRRADLVSAAVTACQRCLSGHSVEDDSVDSVTALLELVVRDIVREPEPGYGPRYALEELLHELGRDDEILALSESLPRGGNVSKRVTAALYLGKLERAASFWREPRATTIDVGGSFLSSKASVLCMVGEYDSAAFDQVLRSRLEWVHDAAMRAREECLLQAGRFEELQRVSRDLPPRFRASVTVNVLIAQGEFERARDMSTIDDGSSDDELLRDFWLQVMTNQLEALTQHRFAGRLRIRRFEFDAELYNTIYWPGLDEGRLRQVAERLEATADPDLRVLAARAYLWLAVYLGQRWDARFDATLARAEALDLEWSAPQHLRVAMAFFHGDWATFDAAPASAELRSLQQARARSLGRSPPPGSLPLPPQFDPGWTELVLNPLNPGFGAIEELTRLQQSGLPAATQINLLRRQPQTASLLSDFYRVTTLVREGERLHWDVRRWRQQLTDLRAMYDRQPRLFLGTDWQSQQGLRF